MIHRIKNITHVTIAGRAINEGEELTISYIDVRLPRLERQSSLSNWGFTCTCKQCSLPATEAAASDERLRLISELEKDLDRGTSTTVTADTGRQLVELYLTERLDIALGHAYTRAALNYGLFGMEKEARRYAEIAVETLKKEFGRAHGDIAAMRKLAENPRTHWSWEIRK